MWHEVIDMIKGTGNYTPEKLAARNEMEKERSKMMGEIEKIKKEINKEKEKYKNVGKNKISISKLLDGLKW